MPALHPTGDAYQSYAGSSSKDPDAIVHRLGYIAQVETVQVNTKVGSFSGCLILPASYSCLDG